MKLKLSKCIFGRTEVKYLGHIISHNQLKPDPGKVKSIQDFPRPDTVKKVRQFMGLANYYRKFVKDFSKISFPLVRLTRKNQPFFWNEEVEESFAKLKMALSTKPVLAIYNPDYPSKVYTDASKYGIGAILTQIGPDNEEHVIAYYSKTLQPHQENYSAYEMECLAVIQATDHFHVYIENQPFEIITDHAALQWLFTMKKPKPKYFRWILSLSSKSCNIVHRSGKQQTHVDALSRLPVVNIATQELQEHQQNSDLSFLKNSHTHDGVVMIKQKGVFKAVVPNSLTKKILEEYHDSLSHPSITKTCKLITQCYWWKGITTDIKNYVRSCKPCQLVKVRHEPTLGEMITPTSNIQPLQMIGCDTIVLGTAAANTKHKFIQVFVDHATRYLWAYPTITNTAQAVTQCLDKIIKSVNSINTILTDNGKNFISKEFNKFLSLQGIKHTYTSPYHPQCNGICEKLNDTIMTKLRIAVLEKPRCKWSSLLPQVVKNYNSTPHDVTGFSPLFLMYGIGNVPEFADQTPITIEEARKKASLRTEQFRSKWKIKHDNHHPKYVFKEGDLVIRKIAFNDPRLIKTSPKYEGPFVIQKKISDVTYDISPKDQKQARRGTGRGGGRKEWSPGDHLSPPRRVRLPFGERAADGAPSHVPVFSPPSASMGVVCQYPDILESVALTRSISTPRRCPTCHKMVYFAGSKCRLCGVITHKSCREHPCKPRRSSCQPSLDSMGSSLEGSMEQVTSTEDDVFSPGKSTTSSSSSSSGPMSGLVKMAHWLLKRAHGRGRKKSLPPSPAASTGRRTQSAGSSEEHFCATWPQGQKTLEDLTEDTESGIVDCDSLAASQRCSTEMRDSLGEWCIPYRDLEFGEALRSDVHRGKWHGEVMIYTFRDVEQFLDDVAQMSMIRHENLVLFMGACIEPSRLAIVTSMKKGPSLYEQIHLKKHKLPFHSKVNIARQVAQGMGYLHAKGIVHRKLCSSNILLENRVKVCLMDMSCCRPVGPHDSAAVSRGALSYLSPEILRSLRVTAPGLLRFDEQPSFSSDVYAYGSVLYELLTEKFAYSGQPSHAVIWQAGSGHIPPLQPLPGSLKPLLKECWSINDFDRPAFTQILRYLLENLEYSLDAQAVRRSRRLQGLEPQENIAMIKQETQTKMGEYHFQPFRNPSIFTGERNQNPEKWLKEFHRVARYNCWDDSMCLANVYFFLQGTAHRWYENVEEKINSWDIFVKMFSQNFGHHVTQKDQLAENLKTRAQGKEETSDSYIQDVLHLCREVNPAMMENEIVAHLTKGISEEIYQSIIILDIASIDEFIKWCRKIEASNKKRVKKRVVFDRLPNVAAIDSADSESMEDLIRRIVREEVHRALNPESTTPEPSSLKEIIREEIEKNVAAISKPIQRPPPRQSYPNQTRTFNQVPRRQYPTQTPIYNQTPPQRRTDEWRTHDNIPICFNCGRPGHVKRYCRERRQWTQRPEGHAPSTQEPQMGNHQAIRSQTYRRQSPPPYKPIPTPLQSRKKLSVASSFEGEAAGVKNPPSSTAAKLQQNYVEIIIDDIAFSALVDSGSSFSVISDGLRRQLKKTMFKDSGMTLKVADGKNVTSIGRCTISLSISGLEQPLEFIVLPNSNPSIILGWDFLEASNAVIDCGRAEIRLEEAKDVLNSPASMGKVVASRSVVIPAESTKLINVMSEELNGQNQVLFEPSKKVLIGKGLTLPCALFRLSHNKGKLWIVNSSTTAQIVPKGMCLGKIQRVEENNLTAISECSESNKEVKNANHASHADKSDFKFLQNLISDDLSEEQQSQILSILKRYDKIFDKNNEPVKQTSLAKHKIETGNHQPIKHRPYRVSPTERQAIQTEVDKMLDAGIIRHSESPWSSPVILVKKKDGNWRFCVDYRRLNKVTKKDVYPLPRIDDTLDSLKGAKFYSSMDLRSGYWQIEVDEADREKTAFITPDGLYEFLVMPFGLCNAAATFERMMDKILKGLKWTMALCYLDDIVVYSKSFNEHLHRLEIILQCLDKAELRLNPKKCLFGTKRIRVFGHLVDSKGIYPDPEKIEAIAKFPTPKSITDVRSFIGLCSYYRRFIENFAEKAAPLHEVLKKDNKFMWNSDQQDAFDSLKKALMSEPVLAYFEEQLPTELHTDASGYGIGAVLVQINDGKERPVGYASRTLSKAEKNYSTTERECLAAIWAINKFRPYLFGREFVIVTDHHALCWLSNLKDPTGRLARWALKLQEYNVTVVYKSGRKHQDADCLSRNPLQLESEKAYNDEDDDIPSITALTCFEAEQRKDPKICKLIEETERFGAELKGYEMLKGTLYKKNFDPLGNQHLLVIPKHLRLELLKSLHDAPTAGHLGFSKTYERVKNKYFWPGLLRDIRKYVAHCKECQRKKQSTQKPPGLLKAIPPATSPFQRVGMDLLGRFPKSDNGNKWIIVCTDYLTRFAVTKALPTGEAKEAAKFLMEDVVLKHGAPREIITDRGRVFQSKLIAELTNQCSSIHRFTTAYHPQTNGLTERLNKTLANMIAMYVSVEQKDWDVILPYVTFAYNTAKQDTIGFTPFKLIHGREAETTVDTLFPNPHEDLQEDYSQKIASRVEETRQLARLETLKAQEKDKARYDSKHEAMDYNVGDLVWIFIPIRKVGLSEKLMKRYFGPYRVTRKLSDVTFEVEPVDQPTRRRKTRDLVHVLRMKPYHDPEDQADLFKKAFQNFRRDKQEMGEATKRRKTDQFRTEDNIPICFYCNRPGHVAKHCWERRRSHQEREPSIIQDSYYSRRRPGPIYMSDFITPQLDDFERSNSPRRNLPRSSSPYPGRGRSTTGRYQSRSPVRIPSRSPHRKGIMEFITELKHLAQECEFESLTESLIRDRLIIGILDRELKRKLLEDSQLTLPRAISIAMISESTCSQVASLNEQTMIENFEKRNWVKDRIRAENAEAEPRVINPRRERIIEPCKWCGQRHNYGKCPAYGKKCNACGKTNHFAVVCRTKRIRNLLAESEAEESCDDINLNEVVVKTVGSDKWSAVITINGKKTMVHLDTGAQINVLPHKVINQWPSRPEIRPTSLKAFAYGNTELPIVGKCNVLCQYGEKKGMFEFIVADVEAQTLITGDTCEKLEILRRINHINTDEMKLCSETQKILEQYHEVFQGVGLINSECKIYTKPEYSPVQVPPRRIPTSLGAEVQSELEKMVKQGIVTKIYHETEWSHPMTPAPAELLHEIPKSKYYTVLDVKSAYWHIPVAKECRDLLVMTTPFGKFRYNRLPFGLKIPAQIFVEKMTNIFRDSFQNITYVDDLLIYADTIQEHNKKLKGILEKAKEKNIKFDLTKAQICLTKVRFLGHVISQNGIDPEPNKIDKLITFKKPEDKKSLQRIMGLYNYLGKFIPNLAASTSNIRGILRKNVVWHWGPKQDGEFDHIKECARNAPSLAHFDKSKMLILQCDASKDAMGAALLQEDRPLAFASASFSDSQKQYSQIEKELLSVYYGCKKFEYLLSGHTFVIQTDHQPLLPLVKKPLSDISPRLQRLVMKLIAFDFKLQYKPGKYFIVADTLSRDTHPMDELPTPFLEDKRMVKMVCVNISDEKLVTLQKDTREDPALVKVIDYVIEGWPICKKDVDEDAKAFFDFRHRLYVWNDLLCIGSAIVIPMTQRNNMLKLLHQSHQGISAIQGLARESLFWPGMSIDIAEKKPLKPFPVPDYPWQTVSLDIFYIQKKPHLLVVDRYSGYPEVFALNPPTAINVKNKLRETFARFGIPETMMSDNGPPFRSEIMTDFCIKWGIKQLFSSPQLHRSNGLAERNIQTVKNQLIKCRDEGSDPYLAILTYGNTPKNDRPSPAQLCLSRSLRCQIPRITPLYRPYQTNWRSIENAKRKRQSSMKEHYDRNSKSYPKANVGEDAWCQMHPKETWTPAERWSQRKKAVIFRTNSRLPKSSTSALRQSNDGRVIHNPDTAVKCRDQYEPEGKRDCIRWDFTRTIRRAPVFKVRKRIRKPQRFCF
ncbi:hypothetical protein LAZ67_3000523 [Cordylochernes scorpioides]|uniref:RNA-directed DNA polymerase n=1 Tax=Cordylochernes scorpioides TaxID=51811 RepID=A0ABY6K7Z4_9ARAC|nr:hypothetical protein LAZ67_3000523 [Cordylochernes scorpioides]